VSTVYGPPVVGEDEALRRGERRERAVGAERVLVETDADRGGGSGRHESNRPVAPAVEEVADEVTVGRPADRLVGAE
jgi:hypothetical protein